MKIQLTVEETLRASDCAMRRISESTGSSRNAHLSEKERTPPYRLGQEILGCVGEIAVARAAGLTWEASVNTFHEREDVPGIGDVRATWRSNGCLLLRDNDHDDRWFWLVTVDMLTYPMTCTIRGRIHGVVGKQEMWWRNDPPRSYWRVPQAALQRPRGSSGA